MWRGFLWGKFFSISLFFFVTAAPSFGLSDRAAAEQELQIASERNPIGPASDQITIPIASAVAVNSRSEIAPKKSWSFGGGVLLHQPQGALDLKPFGVIEVQGVPMGPGLLIHSCHTPSDWRMNLLGAWSIGVCAQGSIASGQVNRLGVRFNIRHILVATSALIERPFSKEFSLQLHAQAGIHHVTYMQSDMGMHGGLEQVHLSFGPTIRWNLAEIPFLALGYRFEVTSPHPHHTSLSVGVHL